MVKWSGSCPWSSIVETLILVLASLIRSNSLPLISWLFPFLASGAWLPAGLVFMSMSSINSYAFSTFLSCVLSLKLYAFTLWGNKFYLPNISAWLFLPTKKAKPVIFLSSVENEPYTPYKLFLHLESCIFTFLCIIDMMNSSGTALKIADSI